jgi:subtilisin family serine protease
MTAGARVRMGALLAVVLVAGAMGAPGGGAAPAGAAPPGMIGQSTWVTLITGDRVAVRTVRGRTTVAVTAAARAKPVPIQEFTQDGDQYVMPADAAALVRSGRVDDELFNVTGLVRQGYDDAHTPNIPLLVKSSAPPAGVGTVARTLPALGITALDEQKSDTARFWRELSGGQQRAAGVEKVWLNARVHASLDESVPQIGAPAAWQAGLTGQGVRVAVLDTGIDTDHPDLAGKVSDSKDFSGKGSVEDGSGHGTHVASTITGSGAASTGKYRGVAPDATLAVGKVLDDNGDGTMDGVLAGMAWAAVDMRAKVVNMSLGAGPTDGTDPVSETLNTLTRQHGTLFVVSAGNFGGDETVATPAAADEALAVASVSKQDELSDFSSRGPRVGDGALKPDVAAPGGGIVAARPDGVTPIGEPVGDAYQRLSGTSMAAPHVAGAAAILVQQHPDWTPGQLKTALMSSATEVEGAGPFAVGAGRVDVARATTAAVTATGSVSTYLPWPNTGQSKRHEVSWHNTSAAPVTLDLSASLTGADGTPAPAGLLTLSADRVTVPAGGSAPIEVTVTAQDGRPGTYGGVLTASTADGTVTTRTALAVRQEEELFELTVDLLDRNGASPAPGSYPPVFIADLDSGARIMGGAETYRLPRGRYAVLATIETPRAGQEISSTTITHPELVLDRDIAQTLDARLGQPVSADPDNAAARGGEMTMSNYLKVRACDCTYNLFLPANPRFHQIFAATMPGTGSDDYAFGVARRATEPTLELEANDGQPFEVNVTWLSPNNPAERATLDTVHAGAGTPEDLAGVDVRGKLVVIEPAPGDDVGQRIADIKNAGGRLVMVLGDPGRLLEPALPTLWSPNTGTGARFATLVKAGGATAEYVNRPVTDLRYELAYGVEHHVSTPQVYRPKTRDLVAVHAAYHDNAPNVAQFNAYREFFGHELGTGLGAPVASGQERIEYFTPGTWSVGWNSAGNGQLYDTMRLVAGQPSRIAWNKAVAGPSFRGLTVTRPGEQPRPWAWRKNGELNMWLPMYGDSAGRPRPLADYGIDTGTISLYRDGVQVPEPPSPYPLPPMTAAIPVPDQAATYRLVADAHRASDHWPLSTTVSTEWTFRSSATDDAKALPLLTARFDPDLNLRNQAPGNRKFSFPMYLERQDGAPSITTTGVDVSYDDGNTWQTATVQATGDHWTVTVKHPGTGHVTLQANATDTDGNTMRQTVVRAYQIE